MADSILKESWKKDRQAELGAYLYALIMANLEVIEEVLGMADEAVAFDRLVEKMGWAAKWRAEGEAWGKAKGRAEGEKTGWKKALDLLKQGHTVEDLERMGPSVSGSS
jgi:predicted transposase YdaD